MRISDWSSDVCSSDLEPLGDAIALEGDDVAGLQRQHLLVTAEAGAIAEFAIQSEADLLDAVLLGPRGRDPLDALHVAAMDQVHIADPLAHRVDRKSTRLNSSH